MPRVSALLVLGIFAFGCNRTANDSTSQKTVRSAAATQSPLAIQPSNSPAGVDSREPELSVTSDGHIILSWVEKLATSATRSASPYAIKITGPRRARSLKVRTGSLTGRISRPLLRWRTVRSLRTGW